jgi:lysophospholipase L1-like esterase
MVPRRGLQTCPRLLLSASFCALLAGCDSPTRPGPLPTNPPQIVCAEPINISDVVGAFQPVTFPPPTVSGGAGSVSVSCSPSSGAMFPLGETTVTCTATDTQSRSATCSFTVTLRHREIATTRFLAFGDSITAGENGRPSPFLRFVDLENRYTTVLQSFFDQRIPGQQITVINAGEGGERVTGPGTDPRLKEEIARHRAQVLLLLHGINDINGGVTSEAVANALRDHIRTARDRGVQYVFVSTLLPTAPDACTSPDQRDPPCRALGTPPGQPADVNQRIRSMVAAMGAELVDPYEEFVANRRTYFDVDGLHPRPEGNRALAAAFWDRIIGVIPARQLMGVPGE